MCIHTSILNFEAIFDLPPGKAIDFLDTNLPFTQVPFNVFPSGLIIFPFPCYRPSFHNPIYF